MRSTRTLRVPSAGTRASSKSTVASTTCSGSRNPRSTCCSSSRRRRKSPAATSTASDSANWAAMSAPRTRPPPRVPPRVLPPESDARTATRADFNAGASPNTKTVRHAGAGEDGQDAGVDRRVGHNRQRRARHERGERVPGPGEHDAADEHGAGREEQALGHQLLHDARRTRAEGEPHRHFVLARRAALQQQVGDVGADDEQHQPADAEHHREQRRHPIDGADVEPARGQSEVAILREARRQPGAGRLRGGARRLEGGAREEAPEHGQPPACHAGRADRDLPRSPAASSPESRDPSPGARSFRRSRAARRPRSSWRGHGSRPGGR